MALDFALGGDLDLVLDGGDLAVVDDVWMDVALLLKSEKGHWRMDPMCGVGLGRFVGASYNEDVIVALEDDINGQLRGYGLGLVAVVDSNFRVSFSYA